MKAFVYDLEIVKAIPTNKEPHQFDIEYCAGWNDHKNMGISVLCGYDFHERRYRVFTDSNQEEFFALAADRLLVTFNGYGFDNRVIAACWGGGSHLTEEVLNENHYDILVELWLASGLVPPFSGRSHSGFSLDDTARINFGATKTGNGALAPIWWQQGKIGDVVDYCLQDVKLTANLFVAIALTGGLISPKSSERLAMAEIPKTFYDGREPPHAL